MHRRTCLAALGSPGLAGLAGCSVIGDLGSEPCSGDDCDVGMTRNAFVPQEYEIAVGDTVRWRNTSSSVHTVTGYDAGIPDEAEYFASGGYENEEAARDGWNGGGGAIDAGEEYEHTFEVPGEYEYVCIPHEGASMVGTIVVTE